MKKILVLNYDDHKGGGVIWTFADKLEEQGHQVFGVPFLKSLDDTDSCFVDVGKKYSIAYFLYKLCSLFSDDWRDKYVNSNREDNRSSR